MTGRVLAPGVLHKPQGDSKSAVLSLNDSLLPNIATPWKTRRQGERKNKKDLLRIVVIQNNVHVFMLKLLDLSLFWIVNVN